MNLERKLSQWLEAGVIDADTRARIAAFEQGKERPVLLYALGGLGSLTIAVGLVSLVAANWADINAQTKLACDLALGVLLAFGLYGAVVRGKVWQIDLLAGIYYGFVIASIALLGQIYQLGSPTYQALLIWSACTLPFMTLVRGRLLALVWLSGLLWTHVESAIALFEWLERRRVTEAFAVNLGASFIFVSALAYLTIARLPFLTRERPQVSAAWTGAIWTAIVGLGFALCFVFYSSMDARDTVTWGAAVATFVVVALHFLYPRLYPHVSPRSFVGMTSMLALICAVLVLGAGFPRSEWPAVAALTQVLLLGLCAFTMLKLGRLSMFNTLTAAIAVRILVAYFEVFGSLLDTGLGMITGGALTLFLAWLWKRKSPELAARFARGGSHVA